MAEDRRRRLHSQDLGATRPRCLTSRRQGDRVKPDKSDSHDPCVPDTRHSLRRVSSFYTPPTAPPTFRVSCASMLPTF